MKIGDKVKYFDASYNLGVGVIQFFGIETEHVWVVFSTGHAGWYHDYNLIMED